MSYPTYVFIDESMKIIQIVPGYKDVASFGKISEFLGDDHFKTTSWEDFNAN
jgi:thioredoxin-related protein